MNKTERSCGRTESILRFVVNVIVTDTGPRFFLILKPKKGTTPKDSLSLNFRLV